MVAKFANRRMGEPVDDDEIAETINFMMGQKLDERALIEAADKYQYQCPKNCTGSLEVPKVNATIWENISTPVYSRDLRFQAIQKSLVMGICAFAQTFTD